MGIIFVSSVVELLSFYSARPPPLGVSVGECKRFLVAKILILFRQKGKEVEEEDEETEPEKKTCVRIRPA